VLQRNNGPPAMPRGDPQRLFVAIIVVIGIIAVIVVRIADGTLVIVVIVARSGGPHEKPRRMQVGLVHWLTQSGGTRSTWPG